MISAQRRARACPVDDGFTHVDHPADAPPRPDKQISAILTGLGIEPLDIQAWSYAEATGHARERSQTPEPS
jgi:hypothetical protein